VEGDLFVRSLWQRIPLAGRLSLDAAMLLSMAVLIDPRASGIAIHEWLGIIIAPVIVFHLTLNWGWVVATTKKLLGRLPTETRLNQVLDLVLFATMAIAIWSGVEISESALPAMGFPERVSFSWREIHEVSSNLSMVLVGAHAALHWKWVVGPTRRLFGLPNRRPPVPATVSADAGTR
jgi:cytochrome b561